MDGCVKNSEKSLSTKIGENFFCGYSMPSIWAFDHIENKHSLHYGENCIKSFVFL